MTVITHLLFITFLVFSRISSRRETMLHMIVGEFVPIAEQRGIRLTNGIEQPANLATITIASDDLEALVMNLLSNALKFTPPGGAVSVHTALQENGDLLIAVSDTGVGIDTNEQQMVFDRYHSIRGETDQVQTGLGLTLVKSIIEGYQGSVSVESTKGSGSVFSLIFPASMVGSDANGTLPVQVMASRTGKLNTTDFDHSGDALAQSEDIGHPHVSDTPEGFRGSLMRFAKDFAFSAWETQVLSLMLQGKSDKEIAIALDLSVKTVANHNRRIYQKARVNSRYELTSKVYAGTAR